MQLHPYIGLQATIHAPGRTFDGRTGTIVFVGIEAYDEGSGYASSCFVWLLLEDGSHAQHGLEYVRVDSAEARARLAK